MDPNDKIRLGYVTGDVAARLRQTLAVTGVSVADFTKEVVKEHLSRMSARDTPRHDVMTLSNPDTIRIIPDPVIQIIGIEDDTKGFLIPNDPGISAEPCPTCGTPCLTCSDGLLPLSEFADMITEAVDKKLR